MPIITTLYYGSHQIVVEYSNWTSKHWVTYDGMKVSEKWGLILGTHHFQVIEDGVTAKYEVKIGWGWKQKVSVKRNGILIFSTEEGFRPLPTSTPMTTEQPPQKEVIVKEVVLVVCPHCNHRNDANMRTCEKCHASI